MKTILITTGLALIISFYSCVPANKLTEEQNKRKACEAQLAAMKAADDSCEVSRTELKARVGLLENEVNTLKQDTASSGLRCREISDKYDNLSKLNDELQATYTASLKGSESNTDKMMKQMQATQSQLLEKEDQLNNEQRHLDSLNMKLRDREARVAQLETILKSKDAAVDLLKKRISDALLGFAGKGISVYEKNGKVYVSMQEALLFPSGSTQVRPEGIEALNTLAKALESDTDINVMVEGHTDNVPMHGAGDIKDNWDLSAMRATSIVKILLHDAKIDPKRLMASGVSEYDPVDIGNTPEAKQKNRRTDIILSPKLSELFKILNTQ